MSEIERLSGSPANISETLSMGRVLLRGIEQMAERATGTVAARRVLIKAPCAEGFPEDLEDLPGCLGSTRRMSNAHFFSFSSCSPSRLEDSGQVPCKVPTLYVEETSVLRRRFRELLMDYQTMAPFPGKEMVKLAFSTRYAVAAGQEAIWRTHTVTLTPRLGESCQQLLEGRAVPDGPAGEPDLEHICYMSRQIAKSLRKFPLQQ